MTIAVNTRFLFADNTADSDNFIFDCFSYVAEKYPQHQFIYIFEGPFNKKYITAQNITGVIAGPPLLWQYWYNYKIPALLKKYKVNILVNAGGICSLRTKIPQCLVVQDLSFLYTPQFLQKKQLRLFKRFMPKFLLKAKNIVTLSEFSKAAIIKKYKTAEEKINTVYPGVSEIFKPVTDVAKETIREKYTEGKEYFLYTGVVHPSKNLVTLLKAFSFFKKRQKSNMQLLIAGHIDDNYAEFTNGLKTFKFRNEVKLLGLLPPEELAAITAAAYAFVYPSLYEDFALPPLQAMQCGVPVILSNTGALPEISGDAALYANSVDFNDIAEKMMLLFKDENKKKQFADKGIARAKEFNRGKAAGLLWESVLKCTGPTN